MYARLRVGPIPVVVVHRRKGRSRIKSKYDIQFGTKGKWDIVCGNWNNGAINTTTDWQEVTCLKCLKKGNDGDIRQRPEL